MGTHPIFESDFDCLTDFVEYIKTKNGHFDKWTDAKRGRRARPA